MRWIAGVTIALAVLVVAYLGTAAVTLSRLSTAVRGGDSATILGLVDTRALSRSLSEQVVGAYLDRIGRTRPIKPLEKMLVNSYGASVAEALIAKMLTADNLTRILQSGHLDATADTPAITGLPAFGDLDTANLVSVASRLRLITPVTLAIRLGPADAPDPAAVQLHFQDWAWKLAGVRLPEAVARDLAATLPVR